MRRRFSILVIGVSVAVLAAGVVGISLHGRDRGSVVGVNGGTVTSRDGKVKVEFGPGDVQPDTRVRVDVLENGPQLPGVIEPVAPLFDIVATDGKATAGTVTVSFDGVAPEVVPERIVMLVEERPDVWRILDTTVDRTRGTATARWPHFSSGVLGCLNPAADFGKVGWRNISKRVKCVAPDSSEMAKTVTDALLPMIGGTGKSVSCAPSGGDWAFNGSGGGGSGGPVLTGCAGPRDATSGGWAAKIGNQHPYAMRVDLPAGVSGPSALDLAADQPLAEVLMTLGWSLAGKTVVPGGGEVPLRFGDAAPSRMTFDGVLDESTLALKTIVVAATVFSRGKIAEVRASVRAEEQVFLDRLKADAERRGKEYTRAEYARDAGYHSPVARQERRAAVGSAALTVWAFVDLMQCGIAAFDELQNQAYAEAAAKLIGKCWPFFASKIAEASLAEAEAQLLPSTEADLARMKALVGEVVNSLRDVPRIVSADVAEQLKTRTGGKVDFTRASLTATWSGAVPTPTVSLPDGKHYALVKSIDVAARTVTVDKVEIFWERQAAQRACREDEGDTDRCREMPNDYYVRNQNRALRTLPVTNDASVTYIDSNQPGAVEVPTTLEAQQKRLKAGHNRAYSELTVTSGSVVSLNEVFTP